MIGYGTDIHMHNSAEKAVKKLTEIIHGITTMSEN
jgi:hypothetical protein